MRLIPAALIAAAFILQPVCAADAAPDNGGNDRGRDRMMQRMIAEHPELKDVDPASEAGKAKIQAVMQEQMGKRMAERQAANHAKLNTAFAMTPEEFKAIEPLLTRVETLRFQKMIADPIGGPGGPGGRGGPGGGRGPFNPQAMLGSMPIEPSLKEVQDATKALKALVDDAQANAAEVTNAVARVRKSREAFQATLSKAQDELRAVLSPRQEAILIEQGVLE